MSNIQYPPPPVPATEAPIGPRPFGEIPALWLKFFNMTEAFFADEAPRASAGNTLLSVVVYTIIGSILIAISNLINQAVFGGMLARSLGGSGARSGIGNVFCGFCVGLFVIIIAFYLNNALTYLGARVLGGHGSFGTQAYLASLFVVPLGLISALVNLIPCLGALVSIALAIFGIILYVRVMKVTHELTTGKALISILWIAIVAILFGCCVIGLLALMGPAIGNVFSNIMNGIGPTP